MDHERVNAHISYMSCGVMELSRVSSDIDGVFYALASRLYHPARGEPCAFFVWSDLPQDDKLARAVMTSNFGAVTYTSDAENPKTGNIIKVYVWKVDHTNFKKWYQTQRVKKLGKVGT